MSQGKLPLKIRQEQRSSKRKRTCRQKSKSQPPVFTEKEEDEELDATAPLVPRSDSQIEEDIRQDEIDVARGRIRDLFCNQQHNVDFLEYYVKTFCLESRPHLDAILSIIDNDHPMRRMVEEALAQG
jgi:hypothetical protein